MISRVTSSSVNTALTSQISNQYTNYAKITQQISSGYKINSILDNPAQAINIVNTNRQMNKIDILKGNVATLTNEIKQSSETIDIISDKAQRAKDLAVNSATGTSGKTSLQATLTEIDGIIASIVDLTNTNYNGKYIYSGSNTKTPAYEIEYGIDSAGNKTNEIIGVKYNGSKLTDNWQRNLEIADGIFEKSNVLGIETFGEYDKEPVLDADGNPVLDADGNPTYKVNSKSGLFSNLMELRNSLKSTIKKLEEQENLPETATQAEREAAATAVKNGYKAIGDTIDGFSSALETMAMANTRFGSTTNKLEMSEKSLTSTKDNLTEYVSGIRDLDITEAVSQWYQSQYAYQASMQASTSIMSMSLLNYI